MGTKRFAAVIVSAACSFAAASPVTYTDASGDQVGSTNKARDIISVSVDNDASNLIFTVNLNSGADFSTTNNFNYGIGITTGAGANGDTQANATTHGNPYQRTLSIDSSLGGMTDWVGVFGAGTSGTTYTSVGYNDYTWNPTTSAWTKVSTVASGQTIGSQAGTATHNTFTLVVPKADLSNLDLSAGKTILFDVYSTGTSAGQTAYDSLADQTATNGTNSATAQYNGTVLDSYTVQTPEPASLAVLGLGGLLAMRRKR